MYPLEALFDDTLDSCNFLITYILKVRNTQQIGKPCNELSSHYRVLGVCELLIEASTNDLFHHLIDSAQTRRFYLQQCIHDQHLDEPERRMSLNAPFFDALAANQFSLARVIGDLSPHTHFDDYEYEDDFLYSYFLYRFISDPTAVSEMEVVLERWEDVLEGNEDARLDVCKAFLAKDAAAFASAFDAVIEEYVEHLKYEQKNAYRFTDDKLVFIEGLALLRIAHTLGFPPDIDYRFCPSLARFAPVPAYIANSFPNLTLPQ